MPVFGCPYGSLGFAVLAASAAALSGAATGAGDLTAPRVGAAVGAIVAGTTQSQVYIVQGSSAEAVAAFGAQMPKQGVLLQITGTSQTAGLPSGIVALMLQANPALTPDGVKCRLMAAAKPPVKPDVPLGFSVFQQGAGLVPAGRVLGSAALLSTADL